MRIKLARPELPWSLSKCVPEQFITNSLSRIYKVNFKKKQSQKPKNPNKKLTIPKFTEAADLAYLRVLVKRTSLHHLITINDDKETHCCSKIQINWLTPYE